MKFSERAVYHIGLFRQPFCDPVLARRGMIICQDIFTNVFPLPNLFASK